MKTTNVFVLFVLCLFGCSSDNESDFDLNLLYGQWFRVDLCQQENSLLLNENGTFESFSSGSSICGDATRDVYKYTGTFSVEGNFYNQNTLTTELIYDAPNTPVNDFEPINAQTEITELTGTNFRLETYIIRENGVREIIETSLYEK